MNPKIKDYVAIAIVIILLITAGAAWKYVGVYADSITPGASFQATGNGKITAIPDVAEFSFGVTSEGGKDIAALQKDNTTKVNSAIDLVKSMGVAAADIETQNYSIQPRYQSYSCEPNVVIQAPSSRGEPSIAPVPPKPCPPASIVGYTISQTVQVKVRDFPKIGDIIAGVTAKGVNNVSGLNFTIDDIEKVRTEARAKAIQDAQEKAQALAKAGHFTLGKIISIQEGNDYYMQQQYKSFDSVSAGAAAPMPAPAIEPGSQEVTDQITLVYEIR